MLRENEAFSFDLKILSKDIEERNFEMIRAEHWHKHQRPAEDLAFDALVSLVTDPYEVCFEMIHMVHYVNKRVHRTVFEAWDPPYLFAEFWIQKQSQVLCQQLSSSTLPLIACSDNEQTSGRRPAKSSVGYRHQSTQVDLVEPIVRQSAPNNPLDHLPSCKKNLLFTRYQIPESPATTECSYKLYFFKVTVSRSVSVENTSVAERIHRMFQEISTTDKK
ncbi:hypothetical protein FGIG_11770 [Fasciola gigantica]|uniref:Uncharacterized protein n=1 Tax=Fasciola gigantica TaxID=46835 RepID=A0A504YPF9_FASGI|nr:hypothetical protein FGIG_11770 [Fasciola gigantica]